MSRRGAGNRCYTRAKPPRWRSPLEPLGGRRSTLPSTRWTGAATAPSYEWRRDFSLILGLDRVLSDPQPKLASGTTLRRHQVDALAGQLAALISDVERGAAPEDEEDDDEPADNGDAPVENGAATATATGGEAFDELLGHEDPTQAVVEDVVEEGEHGPDPAPAAVTASSIPPPPARRSPRPGSSRRPGRPAS